MREIEARGHLTVEGDRDGIEGARPRIARSETHLGRERLRRQGCQGRRRVEPAARHGLAGEAGDGIDRPEDGGTDLGDGDAGLRGGQQGNHARHLRGGLRGARHAAKGAVGTGGVDPYAWSAEVDRCGAVVGEAGEVVVPVSGGDRDHVREVEADWIQGAHVAVDAAVASGCYERDADVARRPDGVLQHHRRPGAAAPTRVDRDDVGAVVAAHHGGVIDRGDSPASVTAAVVVINSQWHDRHLPVDAGDADPIVADRADDARHMRAVSVAVLHVVVVLDEVPAVHVVDVAVVVAVDSDPLGFTGIRPDVGGEIGVGEVDPGVDDRHHHALRTGGDIPRLRRVDVGADQPVAADGGVAEAPLRGEARVIRDRRGLEHEVGLERIDAGSAGRPREHVLSARTRGREREEAVAERGLAPGGRCRGEGRERGCLLRAGGESPIPMVQPCFDGLTVPLDLLDEAAVRHGYGGRAGDGVRAVALTRREKLPPLEGFRSREGCLAAPARMCAGVSRSNPVHWMLNNGSGMMRPAWRSVPPTDCFRARWGTGRRCRRSASRPGRRAFLVKAPLAGSTFPRGRAKKQVQGLIVQKYEENYWIFRNSPEDCLREWGLWCDWADARPGNDASLAGSAGQGRFTGPRSMPGGSGRSLPACYQRASRPRLAPFRKMPSPELRPVPATLVFAKSNWFGARASPPIQTVL